MPVGVILLKQASPFRHDTFTLAWLLRSTEAVRETALDRNAPALMLWKYILNQ